MPRYLERSTRETKEERLSPRGRTISRVHESESKTTQQSAPQLSYASTYTRSAPRYDSTRRTYEPLRTYDLLPPYEPPSFFNSSVELFEDNRALRQELRESRVTSRRLDDKLTRLNVEMNDVLLSMDGVALERDTYRDEVHKLRSRVADLNVHNLKLETQSRALERYLKVVKDDLEFYKAYYNYNNLTADERTTRTVTRYESDDEIPASRVSSFHSTTTTTRKCKY